MNLNPEQLKARWLLIKQCVEKHKLNKERLEKRLNELLLSDVDQNQEVEHG